MDKQAQHWDQVYRSKSNSQVSWYRPHLETSLALIQRAYPLYSTAIIDVGGGGSTLVDDLLALGYEELTVLDISPAALGISKQRLGKLADEVEWVVGNICEVDLPPSRYDLWHDRAVFHFLTWSDQRAAYRTKAAASIMRGGHLIVSTFGPEGPTRCSGLEVVRYDAAALQNEFGSEFSLVDSRLELHTTPFGGQQQFLTCLFERA